MKPFRALGIRFGGTLRCEITERELPDLSTFTERPSNSVNIFAVTVAPPAAFWTPLSGPIPGTLVEGTLPGDPHARFLLRVPKDWDGRLVVSGSPGLTCERGYDLYWSDFLLSQGCAFACTDKGVRAAMGDGGLVYIPLAPENGVRRWFSRLKALAAFASGETLRLRGAKPRRVYAVGVSNGGFLAKKAAEEGGLFDGAVEVSGVTWTPERNFLTQLPAALRASSESGPDRAALEAAGYPAEPAWDGVLALYRSLYWENSLAWFLGDLDPAYAGELKDYDLSLRPASVGASIREFAVSGSLSKPLFSLGGRKDFLVTHEGHFLPYQEAVRAKGKASLHRTVVLENATHVDKDREFFPFVEPLMPKAHEAFQALVRWVEEGETPAIG